MKSSHNVVIDGVQYEGIKKVMLVDEKNFERIIFDDTNGVLSMDPEIWAIVEKHHEELEKKFKEENPCPECGSHNVYLDGGTPRRCNDCGHEW